jgi:hypothetical protein
LDLPFDGNSTSLSFQLAYPETSQFVVVVSNFQPSGHIQGDWGGMTMSSRSKRLVAWLIVQT